MLLLFGLDLVDVEGTRVRSATDARCTCACLQPGVLQSLRHARRQSHAMNTGCHQGLVPPLAKSVVSGTLARLLPNRNELRCLQ